MIKEKREAEIVAADANNEAFRKDEHRGEVKENPPWLRKAIKETAHAVAAEVVEKIRLRTRIEHKGGKKTRS